MLPFVAPTIPEWASQNSETLSEDSEAVYFINDGIFYRPEDYLKKLQEINTAKPIERDNYASGGTMEKLLQKFTQITGKEAAIYMPSGTLANQLAIQVLSGANTKAFVQETSHVYRDEGDAAQTLFNKRLIPLAKNASHFTLDELKRSINEHKAGEYVPGNVGVISMETPVRRCDNQAFPFDEMKRISGWCRSQGYRLHLDGARLHMATAYTGIPVRAYAELFDTVYLCLYKYLGATGGAVLCGDASIIQSMHHLVKIHGGSIFTNWTNAAIALHHLEDIDHTMGDIIKKSDSLFKDFKKLGLSIQKMENGTNLSKIQLPGGFDPDRLNKRLRASHNIIFGNPREDGFVHIKANPTLLRRSNELIIDAFKEALNFAKV